ncbi:hypothetical protein STEG23_008162 [Scotinomys teguina]
MDKVAKRVNCEAEASPWFITGGGLNIPDSEQVKVDLQKILRKKGMDNVPLVTFSIWRLIKDALLTDKVLKVKEQLVEAEQSLEKIQEEEVRKSVSATDTQSEDEEESQFETKAQEVKVKVKEFSFSSSSESDSEEEERLSEHEEWFLDWGPAGGNICLLPATFSSLVLVGYLFFSGPGRLPFLLWSWSTTFSSLVLVGCLFFSGPGC